MNKRVLIIKCASNEVIDTLIEVINLKYKFKDLQLYSLLSQDISEQFKIKYPRIKQVINKNKFFVYHNFIRENTKIQETKFDEIYIPCSYYDFYGFNQVFMIALKFNSKKYFIFNKCGALKEVDLKFCKVYTEEYLGEILFFLKLLLGIASILVRYTIFYLKNIIKNSQLK